MSKQNIWNSLRDGRGVLRTALLIGLLVRLAILAGTGALGTSIVDEQHYARLGANLLAGHGFAMESGQPTSIRPPLFPGLLAATWAVTGSGNLQAIRALQILMGLVTAWLVLQIGRRVFDDGVGRVAAAIAWLYPSLIFANFLILTETLFTLLLTAFVLLAVMLVQSPRAWTAVACGAVLALAALTRSVLWPVPIVLCPLLFVLLRRPPAARVALCALVLAGYALVITPWAVRNTRLQGVFTVVDTMGGLNLRMGNYEYTPEDRMWDAVSLTGEKSWVYALRDEHFDGPITEGVKDKWAQRKAIEYITAHPVTTMRRSVIKFADFWGLERDFIAGVRDGFFAPPLWFQVAAALAIVLGYAAIVLVGGAGVWLAAPEDWRLQIVLLFPVVLIAAAHTIVFGHPRYHVPLVPILGIYAAALAVRMPAPSPGVAPMRVAATLTVVGLLAMWGWQVAVVDAARIASLAKRVGL